MSLTKKTNIKFILLIGFLALVFVGYLNSLKFNVINTRIANITPTSAVVVYITDKKVRTEFVISENSEIPIFNDSNNSVVYKDKRDTKQDQKRFIHYVELSNLKPETDYFFKIKNGFFYKGLNLDLVKTKKINEQLENPEIVYGELFGKSGSSIKEGVVLYSLKNESEFLSTLVSNSSYSLDVSSVNPFEKRYEQQFVFLSETERDVLKKEVVIASNQDQPVKSMFLDDSKSLLLNTEAQEYNVNFPIVSEIDLEQEEVDPELFSVAKTYEDYLDDICSSIIPKSHFKTDIVSDNECAQIDEGYCCKSKFVEIPLYKLSLEGGLDKSIIQSTKADFSEEIKEPGEYDLEGNRIKRKTYQILNTGMVMFYFDNNENNKRDGDEPFLTDAEKDQVEVKLQKTADIVPYNLNTGWNLIAVPMVMEGGGTSRTRMASGLLKNLNRSGANITHVSVYRNGFFLSYSERVTNSGSVSFGDDFELIPGEGIFVKNYWPKTVELRGKKVDGVLEITVHPGWNLVNFYNSANENLGIKAMMMQMNNEKIEVDVLSSWDDGLYSNYAYKEAQFYGIDRKIFLNKGYWVKSNSTVALNFKPVINED